MGNFSRMIVRCGQRLMQKRSASSLICSRSLASKSSAPPARRNSSSQPCLVLPPDLARGQIEDDDDKDDEKENDRYYYSLEEKKMVRVKDEDDDTDNSSSSSSNRKRILLPWERDMLLAEDAICVGSSHGWVAYLNPHQDCSLYLFKHPPLSSPDFFTSGMFRLPPLQTHPRISAVVTTKTPPPPPPHSYHDDDDYYDDDYYYDDYDSPPVTRDYYCWDSTSEWEFDGDLADFIPTQRARSPYYIAGFLQKLVLSTAPSPSPSLSLTPVVDTAGCIALALVNRYKLAFCRLGDPEWTPLKAFGNYSDLIYSTKNRCFHALLDDRAGWLDCIDFSDPSSPQIYMLRPSGANTRNGLKSIIESYDLEHLVECSGEILMIKGIIGHHRLPDQVHVYKLDYVKQTWESVKRIGDHALFVGLNNHSFSLSTLDFPHLNPNSIYFIRTKPKRYYNTEPHSCRHHIGVFSMEDNTFEECCTLDAAEIIYPTYQLPLWVAPCNN